MPPTQDLPGLLERIKNRDDSAMCQLIETYGPAMKRMAEKLVGPALQAHVDPADVVQEVQLTLWIGIRTGRFCLPNSEHLLALTKTLLRRSIARYWKKVKADSSMMETMPEQDLSAAFTASETQQSVHVDEIMERFLSEIDEIDQNLIKMRFGGYTTADAARVLELDPGFLRVRLGRLRQRFANLWPQLQSLA